MKRDLLVVIFCGISIVLGQAGDVGAGIISLSAFTGHEQLVTFTPGFTSVDNLISGPINFQTLTLTSTGTVPTGSGSKPFETWFGIKSNANQSGWFSNIAGSSQGNLAVDNASMSDITIDFSTPVRRAGLLLASPINDSWTVDVFGTQNNLLVSFQVSTTGGHAVFAGYESSTLLGRFEISQPNDNGFVTAFDDVRFESIPEPSSLSLVAVAGLLLSGCRRFSRKRTPNF